MYSVSFTLFLVAFSVFNVNCPRQSSLRWRIFRIDLRDSFNTNVNSVLISHIFKSRTRSKVMCGQWADHIEQSGTTRHRINEKFDRSSYWSRKKWSVEKKVQYSSFSQIRCARQNSPNWRNSWKLSSKSKCCQMLLHTSFVSQCIREHVTTRYFVTNFRKPFIKYIKWGSKHCFRLLIK